MTRAPFRQHEGVAAPLLIDNVDTDQIIPSREMKAVSRDGLADGLFAGWRYTAPGGREPRADFVLNRPEYAGASILLAGENFGCGSSREHAVWALAEFGVRVIIAEGFGDIFAKNCVRNGVLPIAASEDAVSGLASWVGPDPQTRLPHVDLKTQCVTYDQSAFAFEIDAYSKRLLLNGLDPIGLTLEQRPEIDAFLDADAERRPWLYAD
ncbi:MAG: 3-isopropylmalate dehydratase small subunit [Pseudomonadota bacterium]